MNNKAVLRLNTIIQHLQELPSVDEKYIITKNNLEDIIEGALALINETNTMLVTKSHQRFKHRRKEIARANTTIAKLKAEIATLKGENMNIEEGLEALAIKFHNTLILVGNDLPDDNNTPVTCPFCNNVNTEDIVDYHFDDEDYTLTRCNTCGEYFAARL